MLDGEYYSSNFSDDGPDGESRLLLSEELLVALKAIEREISQFMHSTSDHGADPAAAHADDQADS